jgi:beta-N-acetylhexosaminidase
MLELSHLTLAQRVGQLFLIGFQGTSPDGETQRRIDRIGPGGLVLFRRNIESLDQICDLNTRLAARSRVPPFLAIDHEGGPVDRLKHVLAPAPSLGDLADSGPSFVRSGARVLAGELKAAGFNTNLSPILDLGLAGSIVRERSLAAGAGEVTRLARIQIAEFRKKQILSSAAHFPGLGGAREDPHFVLPSIRRSRRELLTEDVAPFSELVGEIDMIRVSHAHYPALGDLRPLPASLSRRVVTDLLRDTLGFDGVILTDDLTMGAITSRGLTPRTFLDALEAGNDMVFFGQATPLVEDAFRLILGKAARDPRLMKRIDASLVRIRRLKRKLDLRPVRHRAQRRSRLIRQIARLRDSIPEVDRVEVR